MINKILDDQLEVTLTSWLLTAGVADRTCQSKKRNHALAIHVDDAMSFTVYAKVLMEMKAYNPN